MKPIMHCYCVEAVIIVTPGRRESNAVPGYETNQAKKASFAKGHNFNCLGHLRSDDFPVFEFLANNGEYLGFNRARHFPL